MKHLLDVNVLLAAIWTGHGHHAEALAWLKGREIVLCPMSELGFMRISAHRKAYALPMASIRSGLQRFAAERNAAWIADDLRALESSGAKSAEDITDHYLADLAAKHGLKLATFDQGINHPAAELIRFR